MMFGLLGSLLGIFPTIASITEKIIDWQAKKADAQTERERIEADENIKVLQAKRDVLIAESSSPWNSLFRLWLALPPSIYIAKLIVWDKIISPNSITEDLSSNLWWIVFSVYAFYFAADLGRLLRR